MLNHILIKNFLLIDTLDLTLQDGMTVLTGETGAGKSMIIGAIALALGGRVARAGKPNGADIVLTFDIGERRQAQEYLRERELDAEEQCIVRRRFDASGRAKSFINGTPVTVQQVQELTALLINIHGQHRQQNLLRPDDQRQALDAFAGHQDLLDRVKNAFRHKRQLQRQLDTLTDKSQNTNEQEEFLRYRLQELATLDVSAGETEKLQQEYRLLSRADTWRIAVQAAAQATADEERAPVPTLHRALRGLQTLSDDTDTGDKRLHNAVALLEQSLIEIQEAHADLNEFLQSIDADPGRSEAVAQRLSDIKTVAAKYRVPPEEVHALRAQLQRQLDTAEQAEERITALRKELQQADAHYVRESRALHDSRLQAAQRLAARVNAHLHDLAMPQAHFSVACKTQTTATAHGQDEIAFLTATNAGQQAQPLQQVVSGGELSRISLAIEVIIAKHRITPTLIFDEVDVGIGGPTAEIVGDLLSRLAQATQVLTITHLGQVACKGTRHLRVTKTDGKTNGGTRVGITPLNQKQRVEELARMIGGVKTERHALAHAKAMLDTSQTGVSA